LSERPVRRPGIIHEFLSTPSITLLALLASSLAAFGQAGARIDLGRLQTGAQVSFIRSASGKWGMEIDGGPAPGIVQPQPAKLEIYRDDNDIRELGAGYATVRKSPGGIDALALIKYDNGVVFRFHDRWSLKGALLSLQRNVEVRGHAAGGFDSSIEFPLESSIGWNDINFMVPGAIYGDPAYDGDRSPGGTLNYAAHHLEMREDILAAPLFALSFKNGASIALLDPAPRGDTTEEESKLTQLVMTDPRFQFGALAAWQAADGSIDLGFRYPGTVRQFGGHFGEPPQPRVVRRYHPIAPGVLHRYRLVFRFGQSETFPEVEKDAWRWAWDTLKPPILYLDVDQMRRVLLDRLEANAVTIDGRTGMPFALSTVSDTPNWNRTMVALGFVGKDLACANELLIEGDRDKTERGRKMRQTGLAMIESLIHALPNVPLPATGFDLADGRPWDHIYTAPFLRNATESMRDLLIAYQREVAHGDPHPEWLAWVRQYCDWLIQQQRPDGSFPRRWAPASNQAVEPSGTASYNVVPVLVEMTHITGDPKYQQSAIRAADYVWEAFGKRGLFVGGASDNPNITDKEAGMLSMTAYLYLFDATHDPRWLQHAEVAANFAETWIWVWNLPMPIDADDAKLDWKKGVPTVGLQDITAANTGSVDEYFDWAVPAYAELYKETKDPHYLYVARVLLHDTKSMVSIPGRQYDLKGTGWQQENFRLGPGPRGRGVGSHRLWLPWVTANHLHGITGLETYSPLLFREISANTVARTESRNAAH
jgi:hypothetical protein